MGSNFAQWLQGTETDNPLLALLLRTVNQSLPFVQAVGAAGVTPPAARTNYSSSGGSLGYIGDLGSQDSGLFPEVRALGDVLGQTGMQLREAGAPPVPAVYAFRDQQLSGMDAVNIALSQLARARGSMQGGASSMPGTQVQGQPASGIGQSYDAALDVLQQYAPATDEEIAQRYAGLQPINVQPLQSIPLDQMEQWRQMYQGARPTAPDMGDLRQNELLSFLAGMASGGRGGMSIAEVLSGAGAGGLQALVGARGATQQAQEEYQRMMSNYMLQGIPLEQTIAEQQLAGSNAQIEAQNKTAERRQDVSLALIQDQLQGDRAGASYGQVLANILADKGEAQETASWRNRQMQIQQEELALRKRALAQQGQAGRGGFSMFGDLSSSVTEPYQRAYLEAQMGNSGDPLMMLTAVAEQIRRQGLPEDVQEPELRNMLAQGEATILPYLQNAYLTARSSGNPADMQAFISLFSRLAVNSPAAREFLTNMITQVQ